MVTGGPASTAVELSGRDLFPLAAMAGWIAAAGLAGIIATRTWGRLIIGIIVTLAGAGSAFASAWFVAASAGLIHRAAESHAGESLPTLADAQVSWWWIPTLLASLLVLAAGLMTCARGRTWPGLGRKYERTTTRQLTDWQALDLGQDPTLRD
jgi:glucan phosphoethanolaminetransferase (alkaline phosphatase superfamily)